MTRKSLIPIMASSAVALAATLWAGSASAYDVWGGLFHDSESQNLCINNPYQSGNDGTQLVVNEHCDVSDKGSGVIITTMDNETNNNVTLAFQVNDFFNQGRCVDNLYGKQENWNQIVIWTCNGGDTQKWDWDGVSFHYHTNPAFCISVAPDGKLVLFECMGQGNQRFVLTNKTEVGSGGGEGPGKGSGGGGCIWEPEQEYPQCGD